MAQKWVTEDELNYMKMGGKVVYAQEGATAQGGEDQVMQLIQAYAQQAGIDPEQLIAQLQQMSPEEQQQAIQNIVEELQGGQEGQEQNQSLQEEQQEMQGGGQEEIMQEVAQAIQQGIDPQELMGALVQQGIPEEQAGQLIQAVSQQMQGAPQMAKGGMVDPEKAKQILKDGTIYGKSLTDKQRRFFGAMANKSEDGNTIVNFDSAYTTQTAPIAKNPKFKNKGTVDGENTKYPFKQQAGGTAFYDEYRQDATQKLIQGGNLHTYEGKNIKSKGGYVEPHGYNIDVPGPELMGKRKDYLMDANYEHGGDVYHTMPSGRLISDREFKPQGNVGKQDLRRFMTGNVSIQGGQGARYAQAGDTVKTVSDIPMQQSGYQSYVEPHSEVLKKIKESISENLPSSIYKDDVGYTYNSEGIPTKVKLPGKPKVDIIKGSEDYNNALQLREEELTKSARDTYFNDIYSKMLNAPEGYTAPQDFSSLIKTLRERKAQGQNLDYYDDIRQYVTTPKEDINQYINKFGPYNPDVLTKYLYENRDKYQTGGLVPGGMLVGDKQYYAQAGIRIQEGDGQPPMGEDGYDNQDGIGISPDRMPMNPDNYNLAQRINFTGKKFDTRNRISYNPITKRFDVSSNYEFHPKGANISLGGNFAKSQEYKPTGSVNAGVAFPTKSGQVEFTGGYEKTPFESNAYNAGVSYKGATKRGNLDVGFEISGEKGQKPQGGARFSYQPQYRPYGGYVEYNSEGGTPSQVGNRAEWLAKFGTVYPVKADGGITTPYASAATDMTTPDFSNTITNAFKNLNPNKAGYDFSSIQGKSPYLTAANPIESQTNQKNLLTSTNDAVADAQKAQTKKEDAAKSVATTPTANAKSTAPTVGNISLPADATDDKSRTYTKGVQAGVKTIDDLVRYKRTGNPAPQTDDTLFGIPKMQFGGGAFKIDPISMGLGVGTGAMDATANLMGSLGKEGSKAQAFGQGAANAMNIAGAATAPFKDIPVVGQALDAVGKTLAFLIAGPLAARQAAIRTEEEDKAKKLQQYYEATTPTSLSTQGVAMAKYGNNVKNMKQRMIDDIYNDFDKYMKK